MGHLAKVQKNLSKPRAWLEFYTKSAGNWSRRQHCQQEPRKLGQAPIVLIGASPIFVGAWKRGPTVSGRRR